MFGWIRRLFAKSTLPLTQKDFEETVRRAFVGLEAKFVDKPLADVTATQNEAAAKLLTSLEAYPHAVIQSKSQLLVSWTDPVKGRCVVVMNLSAEQLLFFKDNPQLSMFPESLLARLSELTAKSDKVTTTESRATQPPLAHHPEKKKFREEQASPTNMKNEPDSELEMEG